MHIGPGSVIERQRSTAVLTKPVDPDVLVSRISLLMTGTRDVH